ncbi:MAG TPA: EAL domain-containing protein [Solirubrobacteraceae bacterium]|jgi:diguanylate cyclase (GGDEF)-like protein|nr:EAL domain-containing protein [Solirubrobacteraceae bacterium]
MPASRLTTVRPSELSTLGAALNERTADVVAAMMRRTRESGVLLEDAVEERFARVGAVSTTAVARWMSGESPEVAREVGQESWLIFAQLAAQRSAPLNEVTKRCLRWCDAACEVVADCAGCMGLPQQTLEQAYAMLRRSLNVTLVRMCESFEQERKHAESELENRQRELAFLATHDTLTGLPNRALILDRVEQMLHRARRNKTAIAALFIDLDNFKNVNDTFGHEMGDELLRGVAARLGATLRGSDAVGRIGGDEFVVIAGDQALQNGPESIAERLLDGLKQPIRLGEDETPFNVTASIGIACGARESAGELLRDADIAMYHAKAQGPNRYAVFQPGMHAVIQTRTELELDLRSALANEQFFLVYQPTFSLLSMAPTGMEALIRWNRPGEGTLQPEAFIGLLEETGMIIAVGRWVLETACSEAVRWREEGHPAAVAVNVSARQLDSRDFVGHVERALERSDLDPSMLTLEITETALMRNVEATAQRLCTIKELGVKIAIDDFGTGYSSMAHLQNFPVDALKIDRSFVARMTSSPESETILQSLVALGRALSIETLAEGIEQSHELAALQDQSCDSGQGFLYARPLDAADTSAFLERALALALTSSAAS